MKVSARTCASRTTGLPPIGPNLRVLLQNFCTRLLGPEGEILALGDWQGSMARTHDESSPSPKLAHSRILFGCSLCLIVDFLVFARFPAWGFEGDLIN